MSSNVMDAATCEYPQIEREDAAPQSVRDVMLARPKTLPSSASIGQAREFFANPRIVAAVLLRGTEFAGLLLRSDVPAIANEALPVYTFARRDVPTVRPDTPMQEAMEIMDELGVARLVVVGDDGVTLAGLLCLDLHRSGFCRG